MKQLSRFTLSIEPEQSIKVPYNSHILSVMDVNNTPVLWAITNPSESKMIDRKFLIVSQDKELNQRCNETNFIGSFIYKAKEVGQVILHVFEIT